MSGGPLRGVFRYLRRAVAPAGSAGVSDAQLLERFAASHDEAAFELLVWRHSRMVHGVCRRLLRDEQDAEDAFQATLLALARRAPSIGKRESVGGWLYRVAYRVALRARAQAAARRAREQRLGERPVAAAEPDPSVAAAWQELRQVLDEQVGRLPGKYREVFVLCVLAGKSNAEAARELNCPVGTVESRLSRARALLRAALARRGFAVPAGVLAAGLCQEARARLAGPLEVAAVKAATRVAAGQAAAGAFAPQVVALTQGVLQAMLMTRIKVAAGVLGVVLAVGAGAGRLASPAARAEPDRPAPAPAKPAKDKAPPRVDPALEKLRKENERLRRELEAARLEERRARQVAEQRVEEMQRLLRKAADAAAIQRRAEQERAARRQKEADARARQMAAAVADIEAALKVLKKGAADKPSRERALEALERAVKHLKGAPK
jgi:RNA polymerase sigma factor (sigma-70 family)